MEERGRVRLQVGMEEEKGRVILEDLEEEKAVKDLQHLQPHMQEEEEEKARVKEMDLHQLEEEEKATVREMELHHMKEEEEEKARVGEMELHQLQPHMEEELHLQQVVEQEDGMEAGMAGAIGAGKEDGKAGKMAAGMVEQVVEQEGKFGNTKGKMYHGLRRILVAID
jgi:hypothetical protein